MEPIKGYASVPKGTVNDQEVKQVVEVLRVPEIGRINSQNLAGLAREKVERCGSTTGSVPAESVPTFSAGARRASDERRKML